MMDRPLFDTDEERVLGDADFFDVKARIDLKVTALFKELKRELLAAVAEGNAVFPPDLPPGAGRTYKGEHYGNYPWRALDFPANFVGKDHFAFRSLLLWGHCFSFHLLLSGHWLVHFLPALLQNFPALVAADLQLSLQDSPWKWELDASTHLPLQKATPADLQNAADKNGFLKLSRLHPLAEADTVIATGLHTWQTIQNALFR